MTKKLILGMVAMLAFAVFASSLVFAEENLADNVNSAPATDVSSGKIFWKEVGLWFTFNQEKKMEKEMELAQLRLQQAEYASQNNRTKAAEKALDSYNRLMEKANKRSELIKSKEIADSNVLQLAAMDQAILVHQERIEKISNILATANLTDEQRANLEERLSKAQNSTLHLQEVQASKEDKIKTKIMAKGNLTEDEAEVEINKAKENAKEIVPGAKKAWNDLKEEARAKNMTPGEYAKERRQEFKDEFKNSIHSNSGRGKN